MCDVCREMRCANLRVDSQGGLAVPDLYVELLWILLAAAGRLMRIGRQLLQRWLLLDLRRRRLFAWALW